MVLPANGPARQQKPARADPRGRVPLRETAAIHKGKRELAQAPRPCRPPGPAIPAPENLFNKILTNEIHIYIIQKLRRQLR
jgi:hypothetical protein